MPTLVNAEAISTTGAKPVYRSLPLVPPFRQGAAITAVIFTIVRLRRCPRDISAS